MEFMAATPCAGGIRPRAVITKDENAKKIPPTIPLPMVVARTSTSAKDILVHLTFPKRQLQQFVVHSWQSRLVRGPVPAERRQLRACCGRRAPCQRDTALSR